MRHQIRQRAIFDGCHFPKSTSALCVENSEFPSPQSTAILPKVVCNGQRFAKLGFILAQDRGRVWSLARRVASTTADVGGAWLLIASCNFVMYFSERTGLRIIDSVTGYVTHFGAWGTAIPACHAILRIWSRLNDACVQQCAPRRGRIADTVNMIAGVGERLLRRTLANR